MLISPPVISIQLMVEDLVLALFSNIVIHPYPGYQNDNRKLPRLKWFLNCLHYMKSFVKVCEYRSFSKNLEFP